MRGQARPDTTPERRGPASAELVTAVKDRIGVTVACEIVDPDSLERSVGKLQRVLDRRDR